MTEKAVGNLPEPGDIQPGDPGHIAVHDEMSQIVQEAADAAGIILDPPAPPPAVVGQYGHVDAHNRLLANLEQLSEAGIIVGGGGGVADYAVITNVTGTPQRSQYTDADDVEWVSYLWERKDGSFTVSFEQEGLVHCVVGGGGGGGTDGWGGMNGGAGGTTEAWAFFGAVDGPINVYGGAGGGGHSTNSGRSGYGGQIGTITSDQGHGKGGDAWGTTDGAAGRNHNLESTIHQGIARKYRGNGGTRNSAGQKGSCAIRVPAENDQAPAGSWVTRITYYAAVTDGVVTEIHYDAEYGDGTRSAVPAGELIECDPQVEVGWVYDGNTFDQAPEPETPRQELIAELQARLDELTKDKK